MNSCLTIQEKLKDLRVEKKMSLEDLAAATGLSKSALGSYESNDYKDISHSAIITLAKYYNVSTDYLLGMTDNRECSHTDLKFDDETVRILSDEKTNTRLLGEIIKHPDFWKFMRDTEIYVDSLAEMQIRNLNSVVATMRSEVQLNGKVPDSEYYMQTMKACEINETDFFDRLISNDIKKITKDIKDAHRRDKETGDENNPLTDIIDAYQEFKKAKDPMKGTLTLLSKQLGISFNKMDPMEIVSLSNIVKRHSSVYRSMVTGKGRGKK